MIVDKDTIKYIAKLAKLKFTENEAEELAKEFEDILSHFDNIDKEDLAGIEMSSFDGERSVVRKDEVKAFYNKQELFQNAKQMKDGYITIPKVLE